MGDKSCSALNRDKGEVQDGTDGEGTPEIGRGMAMAMAMARTVMGVGVLVLCGHWSALSRVSA